MHTLPCQAGVTYRIAGKGKPAVVLLHPAFADGRAFKPQFQALCARYRVIAIDLPGHGHTRISGPRVDPPPSMANVADAITDIFFAEGVSSAHVVGVSMGGLVAQDFGRRYPRLTRSVTVVGSFSVTDAVAIAAQRRQMLTLLPMVLFRLEKFRRYVVNTATFTDHGRALMSAMVAGFERADLRTMKGLNVIMDASRTDELRCPLMIAVGEHDLAVIHESAERWRAAVPSAHTVVFAGAGHCVNMDEPEQFNAAVIDFFDGVDAG